jgi:hypothetical protein
MVRLLPPHFSEQMLNFVCTFCRNWVSAALEESQEVRGQVTLGRGRRRLRPLRGHQRDRLGFFGRQPARKCPSLPGTSLNQVLFNLLHIFVMLFFKRILGNRHFYSPFLYCFEVTRIAGASYATHSTCWLRRLHTKA